MLLAARPVLARGPCGEGSLPPGGWRKCLGRRGPNNKICPDLLDGKLPGTNCVNACSLRRDFVLPSNSN